MDRTRRLPWEGFERAFASLRSLRDRIARATGSAARFDWQLRMDPQIAESYGTPYWAAERYARLLESIAAAGDEVGLHVHAFRWLPERRQWCEDYGDQDWVDHCVRMATDAYRQAFGRQCRVSSMGHRWLNDATVQLLEGLGIEVDLTIEPGHPLVPRHHGVTFTDGLRRRHGPMTVDLPAYGNVPRHLYRPSRTDFRVADPTRREGICLIPLTAARVPRGPALRLYDVLRGLAPGTKGHVTLAPTSKPRWFRLIVEAALQGPESRLLAMSSRTHMFARAAMHRNICANIDWLLDRADIKQFEFTTSTQAMTRVL